jgi:hypothetical protein
VTTGPIICPIHLFERNRCTLECNVARQEFRHAAHLLRMYWYQRRLGQKPMAAARYRLQFGGRA